jgi:hypothetical protein
MAYWWITHGKTWREELNGGYLWAPLHDQGGSSRYYHRNVDAINAGDVIFSYANGRLRAVGVATSDGFVAKKPSELGGYWPDAGSMARVHFSEFSKGVSLEAMGSLAADLSTLLRGPLDTNRRAKQGYAFSISPRHGRRLIALLRSLFPSICLERIIIRSAPSAAIRAQLRASLTIAGEYGASALARWDGRCPLTGLDDRRLLSFVQMRPWMDCNTLQRIDPVNCMPMAPHYARLFSRGLISVRGDGSIDFSSQLSSSSTQALSLSTKVRMHVTDELVLRLLRYHRENVFVE